MTGASQRAKAKTLTDVGAGPWTEVVGGNLTYSDTEAPKTLTPLTALTLMGALALWGGKHGQNLTGTCWKI